MNTPRTTYTVENLAGLVEIFELRRKLAQQAADRAVLALYKNIHEREAATWAAAIRIVEHTQIVPKGAAE